ncbi:MAG: rhodanese-like domain-containing protein [Cytophagales bacterium]|nr:rhodanese-like domain-containing protein [Cytophagales bacterium]
MKTISVDELKELMDNQEDFQLIDVREPSEYESANIGGELIPLQTVPQHIDKLSKDKQVVIMCRSGKRSANAVMFLEQQAGLENLYNLEGGIMAWAAEIDNSLIVE